MVEFDTNNSILWYNEIVMKKKVVEIDQFNYGEFATIRKR